MTPLITCEHGGNEIPEDFMDLFKGAGDTLETHRGFDHGALDLSEKLTELEIPLFYSKTSRLVIDLNRSLTSHNLFSEYTRRLSKNERLEIIKKIHVPFRQGVMNHCKSIISSGNTALHLSIHSYTPRLNGRVRNADIGILYDPKSSEEKEFSLELKRRILREEPELKIRFNYPYLGVSNSHIRDLREKFPENYLGIMIEVNQNLSRNNVFQGEVKSAIFNSMRDILSR